MLVSGVWKNVGIKKKRKKESANVPDLCMQEQFMEGIKYFT